MAQTTTRPPARTTEAPEAHPAAAHPTPAAPMVRPMPMGMPPLVTDRNLLDQLRQIYQTANRHLPIPSDTKLNKALEDTLEEIAKLAEKAVEGYSG